jgi:hypothetical protein
LEAKTEVAEVTSSIGENSRALRLDLPITAEHILNQLSEDADLSSVAWKRVEPAWFVLVHRESGEGAFNRFVEALRHREIQFESISEDVFWATRSDGW